jgi:hypothetical protein
VNARHSGFMVSSGFSVITIPQLPQTTSPDSESVMMSELSVPQTGHVIESFAIVSLLFCFSTSTIITVFGSSTPHYLNYYN